jgi:hypothetical protein
MSRQRLMNCSADEILCGLLCQQNKDNDLNLSKPDLPAEYVRWVECNEISSATLRSNGKNDDGWKIARIAWFENAVEMMIAQCLVSKYGTENDCFDVAD